MTQQQQAQAQLNAPSTGLNQYIGQLGGLSPYFPGTTNQSQSTQQTGNVTQPLYNNPLSSVAGGAVLGNYVGNLFGPQQQGNSYAGGSTMSPFGGSSIGSNLLTGIGVAPQQHNYPNLGSAVAQYGDPSQYQITPGVGQYGYTGLGMAPQQMTTQPVSGQWY
jgi:hypothetical protein